MGRAWSHREATGGQMELGSRSCFLDYTTSQAYYISGNNDLIYNRRHCVGTYDMIPVHGIWYRYYVSDTGTSYLVPVLGVWYRYFASGAGTLYLVRVLGIWYWYFVLRVSGTGTWYLVPVLCIGYGYLVSRTGTWYLVPVRDFDVSACRYYLVLILIDGSGAIRQFISLSCSCVFWLFTSFCLLVVSLYTSFRCYGVSLFVVWSCRYYVIT